jgi:uncharacterized Ntn-hydrolase superfamily protein
MTYSVIAKDPVTAELGVACQSHFFAVGAAVNWAEPGVCVVATQALVEPSYGWRGTALVRGGLSAKQALETVLADDPHPERRQVAMLDAGGELAVHTGDGCIASHGSRQGDWYSVQGNMLASGHVLDAMAEALESTATYAVPLADRLVAALTAAEAAGGELRGSQAAGMRIVTGTPSEVPWGGGVLDLRVEDHPDPVCELARLVAQQRLAARVVGALFTEGLVFGSATDVTPEVAGAAAATLAEVSHDASEVGLEAEFWRSVVLARFGDRAGAAPPWERAVGRRPSLAHLVDNLAAGGVLLSEGVTR